MKRMALLAAALVAGAGAGAAVLSASTPPRITTDVQSTVKTPLTASEDLALSHVAARIVKHTNQALDRLQAGDRDAAQAQVDKALTLVAIADKVRPVHHVTAHIQAGDLAYEDAEDVPQRYVSIFDDIEEVAVLGPAQQVQDSTAAAAPVLANVELEYSVAQLDLPLAEQLLHVAHEALQHDKTAAALEALVAIQTDAIGFEVTTTDLPLAAAKANLLLAQQRADADDVDGAQTALLATAAALQRYHDLPGAHMDEAATLATDIQRAASGLESGGDASTSIQRWWGTVSEWLD